MINRADSTRSPSEPASGSSARNAENGEKERSSAASDSRGSNRVIGRLRSGILIGFDRNRVCCMCRKGAPGPCGASEGSLQKLDGTGCEKSRGSFKAGTGVLALCKMLKNHGLAGIELDKSEESGVWGDVKISLEADTKNRRLKERRGVFARTTIVSGCDVGGSVWA